MLLPNGLRLYRVCLREASYGHFYFPFYINTLPHTLSPGSNVALYTNDSKLYRTVRSSAGSAVLQRDLHSSESSSNEGR